jgi:hypothetical protein
MDDGDGSGAISGMIEWQEKSKYSEKIYSSAALSTTSRMTRFGLEPASPKCEAGD